MFLNIVRKTFLRRLLMDPFQHVTNLCDCLEASFLTAYVKKYRYKSIEGG
jgi:hypothetical protein